MRAFFTGFEKKAAVKPSPQIIHDTNNILMRMREMRAQGVRFGWKKPEAAAAAPKPTAAAPKPTASPSPAAAAPKPNQAWKAKLPSWQRERVESAAAAKKSVPKDRAEIYDKANKGFTQN